MGVASRPRSGGAAGGLLLRTPPDRFSGADRAAAEAARDAGLDAAALVVFDADPNLSIVLSWPAADPTDTVYQVRRSNAWTDVAPVVPGPAGAAGPPVVGALVEFWGPGQAEALPQGETNRAALVFRARGNFNCLRYRASQAEPNKIVFGADPGIRALTAAQAVDADVMPPNQGVVSEALPDYAVFEIPRGLVARARLYSAHDAQLDSSLHAFAYEVMAGDDDIARADAIGYSRGARDPLGHLQDSQTAKQGTALDFVVDASAEAKRVTFIISGFQLSSDANGYWFFEFEVYPPASTLAAFDVAPEPIGSGNVDVSTALEFPSAANMPRIEIPEGAGAPFFLLLNYADAGHADDIASANYHWISRAALLALDEAGYDTARDADNSLRVPDSVDTGTDVYVGWVTDPNDATKKLLLITSGVSTDDFHPLTVAKPVVKLSG